MKDCTCADEGAAPAIDSGHPGLIEKTNIVNVHLARCHEIMAEIMGACPREEDVAKEPSCLGERLSVALWSAQSEAGILVSQFERLLREFS